jgi:hypothetical protein
VSVGGSIQREAAGKLTLGGPGLEVEVLSHHVEHVTAARTRAVGCVRNRAATLGSSSKRTTAAEIEGEEQWRGVWGGRGPVDGVNLGLGFVEEGSDVELLRSLGRDTPLGPSLCLTEW